MDFEKAKKIVELVAKVEEEHGHMDFLETKSIDGAPIGQYAISVRDNRCFTCHGRGELFVGDNDHAKSEQDEWGYIKCPSCKRTI